MAFQLLEIFFAGTLAKVFQAFCSLQIFLRFNVTLMCGMCMHHKHHQAAFPYCFQIKSGTTELLSI
jgi:hypothetical protein